MSSAKPHIEKSELHLYFGKISFSKSFHSKPEKRPKYLRSSILVISLDHRTRQCNNTYINTDRKS